MKDISAVMASIGGSAAPILHVLRRHEPAHLWFVCSPASRKTAVEVQEQLSWRPQVRFIVVDQFEELGACYRQLRHKIPEILSETRISPDQVLVDYTGGTKTMSAALVLAATELFSRFSYVGGEQRGKNGLGVTVDGHERVLYQGNPWSELAVRETERAGDLWAACQFESAALVLSAVAQNVPHKLRVDAIAQLAEAMAARHRLDFRSAQKSFGRLLSRIPLIFDGRNDFGLLEIVRNCMGICDACSKDSANVAFMGELLDNAHRTAAQGRYEDAAARLYRVMEMQGQLWLSEMTGGLFNNGKCKQQDVAKLPEPLLSQFACLSSEAKQDIKLSLEKLYKALAVLGHEQAKSIATDIAQEKKSRWRRATEKRNSSILAHGVQPIGAEGYDQMKIIVKEFLGFDLTRELNPIPELNPRWLE